MITKKDRLSILFITIIIIKGILNVFTIYIYMKNERLNQRWADSLIFCDYKPYSQRSQ